jgi:hypothetical protein
MSRYHISYIGWVGIGVEKIDKYNYYEFVCNIIHYMTYFNNVDI